ncbi:MAG: NAD(+) synthase [Lachnospiraceae bacterium]|nr:NAD(+) synthase [Lachnospiraceae bacterium]
MKDGYIKVAAVTPDVKVADTKYNTKKICEKIEECSKNGAKVIVFPELCITGYSCGDLFLQDILLSGAIKGIKKIAKFTEDVDAIVFVGMPLAFRGKLYNVAAAVSNGEILGFVPKTYLPNYNEFYEARHFARGMEETVYIEMEEDSVPLGSRLLFVCSEIPELIIGAEICEDLWAANPPSTQHALAGATLIVNPSASDETTGKAVYRNDLIRGQSARLLCGYVYANAGNGESTQDVVYSGHNIIAENGSMLAESKLFANETIYTEIDVRKLAEERRRNTTFEPQNIEAYDEVEFSLKMEETELTRFIDPSPFVPGKKEERDKRCEEILTIQAMGLYQRLKHTNCKCAVVGISGGLDSTLALLVTVRAFDSLGLDRKGIKAVTMPGFGTTDRTYTNAVSMIESLGVSFMEVSIKDAVNVHFTDIGHDASIHDVTYENAQARERTQILMDIANKENGMVIGTGDMSELALGCATYNGDHMSMYGVNSSVPKTLVRHLVRYYADTCGDAKLREVLLDVLDTPVSPELLPPEDGKIAQKTEDIVGPYELHDFFLYNMLRFGYSPKKVYRLALKAFAGVYEEDVLHKWLENFYRRFFTQQFKRSCLPDGPKVGTVAVSPRGDLRMPSDACVRIWMDEVKGLKK